MNEYNCDLQLHGKYASGVSVNMEIPAMAEQARLKGLDVLVSADLLHKDWFAHVQHELTETENGVYADRQEKCFFISGTEVEDQNRIHHLIYLPDLPAAQELRKRVQGKGNLDCSLCGRPRLSLSAEALAEHVEAVHGVMGPAHSFTPYTGMFSRHESVPDCYNGMHEKIPFIELGLSADTSLADQIAGTHAYAFLSSSDAHSPWPHRMGREFNRITMKKPCFAELKKALWEREEKRIILNAGLDPREGKYHYTACNACFAKYTLEGAEKLRWRCAHCPGQIKRGVRDRIRQLATLPRGKHPVFRPPYQHILPLAEIIQETLGVKNVNAGKVQDLWREFVQAGGNEIAVLLNTPVEELRRVHPEIAESIAAFRNGWVTYVPGGGGKYGKPIIAHSPADLAKKQAEIDDALKREMFAHQQKKLGEF